MINHQLIHPDSIAVIGASASTRKPGGKVLENLISGGYSGRILAVNPGSPVVQGLKTFPDISSLPNVDLAILAIPAAGTYDAVRELMEEKGTRAFIILSAGFGELNQEGAALEHKLADLITKSDGCLIGPNCIGIMNPWYKGVFTTPVPALKPGGVTLISGSGATAVFIIEAGIPRGLPFTAVYSMGNSVQTGVEDMVAWLDENQNPEGMPRVVLLYLEAIRKPFLLMKHAASLVRKGIPVVALKAGTSDAGSRAASSHTGAMAGSDEAADALFRKAGIIRCYSRDEAVAVASVLMHPRPRGRNFAIVTHAGGPGVMLTDTLSQHDINIPEIKGPKAEKLLQKLHPGSSVKNPIDFLATGTAEQLEVILNTIDNDFDNIDASVVIFGSPGLFPVDDVYDVIHRKIRESAKPVLPVLPSVVNVRREIDNFIRMGNVFFPDEVTAGHAIGKVMNTLPPFFTDEPVKKANPSNLSFSVREGYLPPEEVSDFLAEAGIPVVRERISSSKEDLAHFARKAGYPVVLKATGLLHKSDAGGVITDIRNEEQLYPSFEKLIRIEGVEKVMIQPMLEGLELFAGVKKELPYGHLIVVGIGGIFIETLKDFSTTLAPVNREEALNMIRTLKGYPLIRGVRGQEGVDESRLADIILSLSQLVSVAPNIEELDLNPLIAKGKSISAVDARIRISPGDQDAT